MIRKLVSRLNRSFAERVVAPRYPYQVPVKVTFAPDKNTGNLQTGKLNLMISGETKDLSSSGIAFIVSAIRIREYYLVGEERALNVEIDLPNGKVRMQVVGCRYEQLMDEHNSVSKYLIGAQISQISAADREAYEEFLKFGKKMLQAKTGNLELGVNKR